MADERATNRNAHDRPKARSARGPVAALGTLLGLLGLVLAIATPLAPVVTHDVTVTWPKAGEQPQSTMAWFVPYSPVSVHAEVPCPVVRTALDRDAPTTIVSSRPPGAPSEGFSITTAQDHVLVLLGGQEALRAPVSQGDCSVGLDADSSGSHARIGDREVALPDERVEDINEFATDLAPEQADGVRVTAQTANYFENSPTTAKKAVIAAQLAVVVLALVLLAVEDRRRRGPRQQPKAPCKRRVNPVRWLVDLAMVAVLGGWWVLGPNTADDAFAGMTVRNGLETGAITNYYRWENASEAPFTLAQHLLEPIANLSINPLALRIPSILAALITWFLLSRGVVDVVLPGRGRGFWVRALAALSLLAWWLPFGMGTRPEPFVALGVTAVLALVLRATTRNSLASLGAAALVVGLSVAVSSTGLISIAPALVLAAPIWRILGGPDRSAVARMSWTLVITALASTGLVAMFADQSLFGVRQATRLHRYYGPNVAWYQEIQRYEYLLGFDLQGDVARRAPVLLTITVLIFTAVLLNRGARRLPGMRRAHVPAACLALGLALLWVTPSKWTHYFGALAGVGAATLTTGVVLIVVVARRWAKDRTVLRLGLGSTALAVVAAALSFAGKNNWFLHSQYGVPWGEQPIRPLNGPLPWLLLVGVLLVGVAVVAVVRDRRGGVRCAVIWMPAAVSTVAVGVTVVILLGSFALAPARQAGSYSVGGQNLDTITGGSCGIVDHLVVTPELPGGVLQPTEGAETSVGFARGTGFATDNPPPDPPGEGRAEYLWGSLDGGQLATGSLTTGWFGLGDLRSAAPDRELALSAAGRTGDGNRLSVEFGTSTPDGIRPLGQRVLDDADEEPDKRPTYPSDHVVEIKPQDHPSWRTLHVDTADIPAGADQVRVHAVDDTTDPAGWLAVSGPRVREVVPMREYLQDKAPILADWSMNWSAPCVRDMPRVAGGLVEPPAYLFMPPSKTGFGGIAAYARSVGGSFAGVSDLGSQEEIPTRLLGVEDKPEYAEWGRLVAVNYPLPGNGFDVTDVPVSRWGWQGEE